MAGPSFAADGAASAAASATSAQTSEQATPDAPEKIDEIVVTGSLGALPLKDVGTIFGFNKTLVETPRSASTISKEQLERFGITQIYDLVTQSPGVFSSSYFGTGGALEIRGTPGEVYFRGMLRLENGGNYPTPIGAAERIDIVRGPASPIYGPSKTGGYMNFVPKTARAENGADATETTGDIEADFGEWNYKVLKGEITGPGKIGNHAFGYSLYGEIEDSDSYYRNVNTRNALASAAFNTDITSNLRTEFGGMYQNFKGQQNSGWNRITQDLIDHGTYITGNPSNTLANGKPIDTNGDGKLSREEVGAANGGQGLNTFGSFGCGIFSPDSLAYGATGFTPACLAANYPDLALANPGTTHLSRKDTLTGPNDKLNNIQKTGYFDLIWKGDSNLEVKNQLFYDGTNNLNENAYGFSQFIKSYVVEDKIVISDKFNLPGVTISAQASPSLRYTHFLFGDDFDAEFWNRPDISTGFVPSTTRLLSTECDCDYSDYVRGGYLDTGIAGLVDAAFDFGLDLLGGVRYDHVHATSRALTGKYDPASIPAVTDGKGSEGGVSWNASISYKTPIGLIPYFTASHQITVVEGEGAELYPGAVASRQFMAVSKMYEAGIKGEFLDKRLYGAVDVYKQQRTDAAAESSLTNQVVKTKGVEAEVRWSVDRHLLVTGNYTYIQVIDQSALAGYFFNYFGVGDLVNVPQSQAYLYLGGSEKGLIFPTSKKDAERPGIPHNVVSGTATYAFDNGIALNGDIQHVDHTFSGYTQHVRLPAYWLLNLGASYKTGAWLFRVNIKNVNNARYFRAGGQDLFGADIALPELPRSWQGSIEYKF